MMKNKTLLPKVKPVWNKHTSTWSVFVGETSVGSVADINPDWLSLVIDWCEAGLRAKKRSLSPVLNALWECGKQFDWGVHISPKNVRDALRADGLLKENNITVIRRGGQIVCGINCKRDRGAAESALPTLCNIVWNTARIKPVPNVLQRKRGFWAEAIIPTSPITMCDCVLHGFQLYDDAFDKRIHGYLDQRLEQWVIFLCEVKIGHIPSSYSQEKIQELTSWFKHGFSVCLE